MNAETENTNGAVENGQSPERGRSKRNSPTRTLPSDRLAFSKQLESLRAFAVAYEANGNKPVTNDDAGKIINMSGNTVVVVNGFFTDTRLLVRQKDGPGLTPTAETLAYYKGFEWDPATAGEKLRPAFERCWFAEALLPRLKFRPYEEREALAVLAEASGASKEYQPRLEILLEYMITSGLVVREGGMIRAAGPKAPEAVPEPAKVEPVPENRESTAPPDEHEEFTFILDPRRKRKVVVHAPHDMSKRELDRVKKWLEIQLIVDEGEEAGQT